MKKTKNSFIKVLLLFFILLTVNVSRGLGADEVYLILIWDQDSYMYSGVELDTGTINCLYNTCAAMKYYPGIHMTFNPPQSLLRELEAYNVETDTSSIPVERRARIKELISTYRSFRDRGILEVCFTALHKPILPLIQDNEIAQKLAPYIDLPDPVFSFPQDVRALVFKGMASYKKCFGELPAGLFPTGRAVSQEVVDIISGAGIKWIVSCEAQLPRSIAGVEGGMDKEDPIRQLIKPVPGPEALFKPYFVSEKNVAVFFPGDELSGGVADISKRTGARAADWLIKKVHGIRRKWEGEETPVVTVALDSSKIWQDRGAGQEFIARLYGRLSSEDSIKTVTPGEWIDIYFSRVDEYEGVPGKDRIEGLSPGTRTGSGFEPWLGEKEENQAWAYLARTRQVIEAYKNSGRAEIEKLDRAFRNIYKAESGDWFWWYGDDYDSGRDAVLDKLFRFLLIDTYKYIGEEPPAEFYLPITSRITVPGVREVTGRLTPVIDGVVSEGEWDNAGCYINFGEGELFEKLYYGYDKYWLYLRLDTRQDLSAQEGSDLFIGFYIGVPGAEVNNVYTRFGGRNFKDSLKYGLSYEIKIRFDNSDKAVLSSAAGDNEWQSVTGVYNMKFAENILELAVPLRYLDVSDNDEILVSAVAARNGKEFDVIPSPGPAGLALEGIVTVSEIIRADDPAGDSNGPGWFTYPENPMFNKDYFDFLSFVVKGSEDSFIIEIRLKQLENTLDSPLGLGPQLIDVYIDLNNRQGAGSTELLEGRNAYTTAVDAWEWVITVNGWKQELYQTGSDGPVKVADLKTEIDGNTIKINIPKNLIRGNPDNWGFIPVMFALDCSEDSPGGDNVKVSAIEVKNDEYHFGGGIEGVTDTNILDVVLPKGGCQSCILKVYKKEQAVQLPAVRKFSK